MEYQYVTWVKGFCLSTLTLALAAAFPLPGSASAKSIDTPTEDADFFDVQMVKARGIDASLAQSFNKAPRFLPGTVEVALTVNGTQKGKVNAIFDKDGTLCPGRDFMKSAGLILPPGQKEVDPCFDLKKAWPQTEIALNPGEMTIDLVVPAQALAAAGALSGNWEHGGMAGMLNYEAQYMGSSGSQSGTDFEQLNTEAGFNVKDWIVRSRGNMSRLNGETTIQHQAAYAQHTLEGMQKVVQVGEVSLANSLFSTGQVLGVQMFPETALQNSKSSVAVVEGIADTQSVVEVRQSGVLVFSTTVPAGPFHLQNFSLLNTRTDLDVKLTGNNGEIRQFVVPASALLAHGSAVDTGLSFGAGKIEQEGSSESPLVATAGKGWALSPRTALNAGVLGSSAYEAAALSIDAQPFDATQLSVQTTFAQDSTHNNKGVSASVNVTHSLTERVSVNTNITQQSSGYRELSDALQDDNDDSNDRSRNQYGAGISWAEEDIGNLSLSWANSTTFNGENTTYLRGGWSRNIGRVYISASIEHNSGTSERDADDRIYINMSIPFGNKSVNSYVTNSKSGSRFGGRYSDRSSQDRGWSISADQDNSSDSANVTGTMDLVTPLSQLSGSISRDSDSLTSWSGHASGSVVAHSHGVTLSPYRVGDTFGIAKVGDESGIRIETPAGPTWTDRRGYAVIPTLSSYRRSAIQIDTRSLKKNVDIANAWQETEAARGAVSYINFGVVRTRRVLATLVDATGKPAPHGASVFNEKGEFITVVGEDGAVFIPDSQPDMKLVVQQSGVTVCSFTLKLPEQADDTVLFETAHAKCR